MTRGTAIFQFFQIFFSLFVFSSKNEEGPRPLEPTCPARAPEFSVKTPTLSELVKRGDAATKVKPRDFAEDYGFLLRQ